MKLLTAAEIRAWDKFTIENEPVTSTELMERASLAFCEWFMSKHVSTNHPVQIFCGNGNNGGDGLVIARMLSDRMYDVHVYILRFLAEDSLDFDINLGRLLGYGDVNVQFIHDELPDIFGDAIIVDALMGTGANKPITGLLQELVLKINNSPKSKIWSVDMPSGLPADEILAGHAIQADEVATFQVPKHSFFYKENEKYCKSWVALDIGLHQGFLSVINSNTIYVDHNAASGKYIQRTVFQHKGDFGHALIIAGGEGKTGAAVLTAKACLKAGAGLVTSCIPESTENVINTALPEAMTLISGETYFSILPDEIQKYTIGIGPGLGMRDLSKNAVEALLKQCKNPLIIDADALNIIADNMALLPYIPKGSVLTPHPGEFKRLFGDEQISKAMFELQSKMSVQLGLTIVLKGAYTRICTPQGKVFINSTGNSGMATAGAGDVLTGIITALLAQSYLPEDAAVLGVYLHGLAGDIALKKQSRESLIASDIIKNIGKAFKNIGLKI
jgi:NAD(P)H-hydrate epimerase